MKTKFARLFEFETGQLLMTVQSEDKLVPLFKGNEGNGEGEDTGLQACQTTYTLCVKTYHDGESIKRALAVESFESGQKKMEECSEEMALEFYNVLREIQLLKALTALN